MWFLDLTLQDCTASQALLMEELYWLENRVGYSFCSGPLQSAFHTAILASTKRLDVAYSLHVLSQSVRFVLDFKLRSL
jgi:hypothetical protein